MKTFALLCSLFAGVGCALQPAALDPAALRALPVVNMGMPTHGHKDKDYVLHVPRGQAFPIDLTLGGGPLAGAYHEVINATLTRDIYLYQHWGSYDGRHWRPLRQMLGIGLSMGMDTRMAFIKVELSELGR